jgi:hypothetical protein
MLTTKINLSNSAYTVDEIVDWCNHEYGQQGEAWMYEPINNTEYKFMFHTTKGLVRFGLTWNKLTLKARPRMHS